MSPTVSPAMIDPLHAFVEGAFISGSERPVPLISTRFHVNIEPGMAIVSTTRIFRNDEKESIEATITFPIPVHAVLFALEARIDGRALKAQAQRKSAARETYEDAIERGKSTILHEEVLRGVHMLSVGHIPPGAEVAVLATWTVSLTNVNGHGQLRIPLTVGNIYGHSGLPDTDELTHGGPVQMGELTVKCSSGLVTLQGGALENGTAQIPLNAPIDFDVTGWTPTDLRGRAADGREVVLRIEPSPTEDRTLDVALLIDHSGSMAEVNSADGNTATKHQLIVAGLHKFSESLRGEDIVDLWEFDDAIKRLGATNELNVNPLIGALRSKDAGNVLQKLIQQLSGPAGGTEIGSALSCVSKGTTARDILIITDGKSHALDVQALARTGRRFSVVLVGEDSLEANVGYLAALTGGEIFVATGADLTSTLIAALDAIRSSHVPVSQITEKPTRMLARRAGMTIVANWHLATEQITETPLTRAVAALSTSLVLPAFNTKAASDLAEAEGLVTHLTSLVLVDESASVQEGIPATRKVALPTPRRYSNSISASAMASISMPTASLSRKAAGSMFYRVASPVSLQAPDEELISYRPARVTQYGDLSYCGRLIDWNISPAQLQAGDLSSILPIIAEEIRKAASIAEVIALAKRLGIGPIVLVIALIAQTQSSTSRSAARIAKSIIGGILSEELRRVAEILHLD